MEERTVGIVRASLDRNKSSQDFYFLFENVIKCIPIPIGDFYPKVRYGLSEGISIVKGIPDYVCEVGMGAPHCF